MMPKLRKEVDAIVKEHNYSSVSEFFRDAMRAWKNAHLVSELHQSRREAMMGKSKKLTSLKELRSK